MLRWIAYIESLDLEIRHISGRDNAMADMLSRARFDDEGGMVSEDEEVDVPVVGYCLLVFIALVDGFLHDTGFLRPNSIWRMPVDARLGGGRCREENRPQAQLVHRSVGNGSSRTHTLCCT